MTRSGANPRYGVADRYDTESCPSDDYVNVFDGASDDADHSRGGLATADGASSHPRASLHLAAKQLLEHLTNENEEFLDVDGVADFLQIPRTAAHCILDVLDVFQIIIPRGSMYTWRGTTHVALLLQSDKFKPGASMQCGIAVPKVCRAMIPHLRDNVGVEFTVEGMAKWLWEAQDSHDAIPTIVEAHAQQLRALSTLVSDILAVVQALGYIDYAVCQKRGAVYLYNPHTQSQLISPKGMQQSARMRNMRHLFDGPAPTPNLRPGTSASQRSIPISTGGSSRPYTPATNAVVPHRGRARAPQTAPPPPRNHSAEAPSQHAGPPARTGRTPPPPRAYARGGGPHARHPRHIFAARAPVAHIAPYPQPGPLPASSGSWRNARGSARRTESDEDVRSAVYPTMSEWCSMQQELVDRGGCDGGGMHEDVFSDGASDVMPLVCEDMRRGSLGVARMHTAPGHRMRDQSCSGRVERVPPRSGSAVHGGVHSRPPIPARGTTAGSGYYRRGVHAGVSGMLAGKDGGDRRSSSVGPRAGEMRVGEMRAGEMPIRDVDRRAAGGVAKLKHMFETTRMSRIGGFGGSTRVHHMVQRYEDGGEEVH